MSLRVDEAKLKTLPPAAQRELREDLEAFQAALEDNPLLSFMPHAKQKEYLAARTHIKAFFAGNRVGKSSVSVVDAIIQAIDPEAVPPHLAKFKYHDAPFYCRFLTPDLTRTMEGVIFEKLREYCPRSQLKGGSWDTAYDKQNRVLRFANGSWFDFMTYEQDLDKFGGAALHRVCYDEEPPGVRGEQIRRECQMRLVDFDGQECFTMTPLLGHSFVHEAVWERRFEEDITCVKASMADNPHLSAKARDRILAGLTKEQRQAREHGEFVSLGGLFFPEFTEQFHVVDPPPPAVLKDLTILCAIDPGYERAGILWGAFDSENDLLIFDEFYPHHELPPQHCAEIKRRNDAWGVKPSRYVIDPAVRIRGIQTGEALETAYVREGIYAEHGNNSRGPGIIELKRRFQHGKIKISKDCRNLIWELSRYQRHPNSEDEWAEAKGQADHLVDALRYLALARAWGEPKTSTVEYKRIGYDPTHQAPYRQERPIQTDSPPLGAMS